MNGSIHQYISDQLQLTKGRWRVVAKDSGVPYRTVEKIGRGDTENPRRETIEKLAAYFQRTKAS